MTIEAILNLVWLGVTLAALWLWRFRWKGARRSPGHNVRLEAVAMICILALLFPVISLTDDLHPEVIPVDATSSKRALCLLAAQHAHGSHAGASSNQQFVFAVFRDSHVQLELGFAGYVRHSPALNPLSRRSVTSERAPPSLA
ncbi:MAG TPA: hypothetical protein VNY09_05230 [Candidatus Sulfotelmatobacter sp.]|jgi:hypothetical protein|nr:hypothetical protein [Candidatus Sulfotelmatobacter sp.]